MKFSMATNPAYQVDFCAAASGKRVAATKRRVRFRFGFSSADAIARGLTGTECRGEEHEVSFVWSLTSGKRLVLADGEEVHFSQGRRADTMFETAWTMSEGHVLKLIAHAAPPLFNTPGFRQFDLTIDGLSYFDMPKIFKLGVSNSMDMVHSGDAAYESPHAYTNYTLPPQEHAYWEHDMQRHETSHSMDRSPTFPGVAQIQWESTQSPRSHVSPLDIVQEPDDIPKPIAMVNQSVANMSSVTTPYNELAPVDRVAQSPSTIVIQNQIRSAYGAAPTMDSSPEASYEHRATPSAPPQPAPIVVSPDTSLSPHTAPVLSMNDPPLITEEELVSEMERALKSLVNVDDIELEVKTPEQLKAERKKEIELNTRPKSKGLPPTALSWHLGSKPSLKDIRESTHPRAAPSKEVMRTHHVLDPGASQTGILVVYGQPANISPPIQSYGFGVPASTHMAAYGYPQPRQPQPAYAAY